MSLGTINTSAKVSKWILYPVLVIVGILIILLCNSLQHVYEPKKGEYYYSTFLKHNYTFLSNIFFFFTGVFIGYYYKLNPWYSALCLFLIYPLTSITEGIVYEGSHNRIPFEFLFYVLMALPTVVAVYIGRYFNGNPGSAN